MSRAQGDGYRTWTDEKLNAYRRRLDEKLKSLRDHKEKWYDSDGFRIHTESENILENPRGDWKWDGWKITGRRYWIRVYEGNDPWAIVTQSFTDRDEANEFFKALLY